MTVSDEGLKRIAESVRKMPPREYCEAHKPCDAKEHQPGHKLAMAMFVYVFGVLGWGCVLMLAANSILADWLGVVGTLSYWQALIGTAGLYALTEIRKGLG